jgi:hypothetical protein
MTAYKICSSLLLVLLTGCLTSSTKINWPVPNKPVMKKVSILPMKKEFILQDGYYINKEYASNLVENVDSQRAYSKKLELLIKEMTTYYGDKTHTYEP